VSFEGRRHDEGFTLVELAIVILIIGLLVAIAIPSFLRVQRGAQDRSAQSTLRAMIGASAAFHDEMTGYDLVVPEMQGGNLEADLITVGPSTGPRVLRVDVSHDVLKAAALSRSGVCFEVEQTDDSLRFGRFKATPSVPCEPGNAAVMSPDVW
jgi:prepilin-type N-terminal cleavage/methylation domain-containing protein